MKRFVYIGSLVWAIGVFGSGMPTDGASGDASSVTVDPAQKARLFALQTQIESLEQKNNETLKKMSTIEAENARLARALKEHFVWNDISPTDKLGVLGLGIVTGKIAASVRNVLMRRAQMAGNLTSVPRTLRLLAWFPAGAVIAAAGAWTVAFSPQETVCAVKYHIGRLRKELFTEENLETLRKRFAWDLAPTEPMPKSPAAPVNGGTEKNKSLGNAADIRKK